LPERKDPGPIRRRTVVDELKPEWKEPLLSVLEGQADLLRVTSHFPGVGKLPALLEGIDQEFERVQDLVKQVGVHSASGCMVIVVVVVCVAVAARPGGVTSEELLRAKLLDVYSVKEREALRQAVRAVKKSPELVQVALGVEHKALGKDFMQRLEQVDKALA